MIGVLDLQIGNLRSVCNAVYEAGFDFEVVVDGSRFSDLTHLILPGVGNFASAAARMVESGLVAAITDFALSGRPILGLCLGMHLLATIGTENGKNPGLGLVPGKVRKFDIAHELAVPHVGWNELVFRDDHPVFDGIKTGHDFYFVHSYHFVCDDEADAFGETDYGGPFTSVVGRGNVLGFQFHPEKSQINGLGLLENFCDWDGAC